MHEGLAHSCRVTHKTPPLIVDQYAIIVDRQRDCFVSSAETRWECVDDLVAMEEVLDLLLQAG
jgi:hypothetical protein